MSIVHTLFIDWHQKQVRLGFLVDLAGRIRTSQTLKSTRLFALPQWQHWQLRIVARQTGCVSWNTQRRFLCLFRRRCAAGQRPQWCSIQMKLSWGILFRVSHIRGIGNSDRPPPPQNSAWCVLTMSLAGVIVAVGVVVSTPLPLRTREKHLCLKPLCSEHEESASSMNRRYSCFIGRQTKEASPGWRSFLHAKKGWTMTDGRKPSWSLDKRIGVSLLLHSSRNRFCDM